jgi:hypothetical protein
VIALLLLTLGLGQLHGFGAAWAGDWLPDPFIGLAAFAGLYLPRASLLPAAVVLGWGRGLVHMESAGAHVLCAWLALAVIASQRDAFERDRGSSLLLVALLAALCWCAGAALLSAVAGTPVTAGWPLVSGALAVLPCATLARRLGRRYRVRA